MGLLHRVVRLGLWSFAAALAQVVLVWISEELLLVLVRPIQGCLAQGSFHTFIFLHQCHQFPLASVGLATPDTLPTRNQQCIDAFQDSQPNSSYIRWNSSPVVIYISIIRKSDSVI